MKVFATFDSEGFSDGHFYDELSYPPVMDEVRVRPENGDEIPEEQWPAQKFFVRRNDLIPAYAIEISEADRMALVQAPQFCKWINGRLVRLPLPELTKIVMPISDRQFFQQLAIDKVITEDEALATSDGTIPQLLLETIDLLPAEQQFAAKMLVRNATSYERQNPLVAVVGARLGWDSDRLDRLWVEASKL